MDEYYSDNRPELIHCENCGEDYAATYRVCPFCHTAPNGKKAGGRAKRSSREGNRVRTNTRGGGYGGARSPLSIIGIILAVILAIAAVIIVIVLAKSALSGNSGDSSTTGGTTSQGDTSEQESSSGDDEDGESSGMVVTPDGLTLDQTELTLSSGETATLTATTDPVNWVGQIIWATSDAAVATVDQSGVVTYAGDGTCTITASASGVTAECAVTCGSGETTGTSTESTTLVVKAYGNEGDDFTFNVGDVIPFKAEGGDGTNYTWSVGDASIASVDSTTGSCTGLSEGKTTLTVTSGSESLTVTIRVKAS